MEQIKTLKQFQAAPNDLLCNDDSLAKKHNLNNPFWVTRCYWMHHGIVCVELLSRSPQYAPMTGHLWGTTEFTTVKNLFVPDSPPPFGSIPEPGPTFL